MSISVFVFRGLLSAFYSCWLVDLKRVENEREKEIRREESRQQERIGGNKGAEDQNGN